MPTIRRRGDRWNAQVRVKHAGQIVHQESATFDTKQQATLWALKLEQKIASGGVAARKSATTTVRSVVSAYEQSRVGTPKPWGRGMQHSFDRLLSGPLADHKLSSLTADKVMQWAKAERARGSAASTVMHHLAALRAAMGAAVALCGVEVDAGPVSAAILQLRRLRVVGVSVSRNRRPTQAELDAICGDLAGNEVPTDVFVRLAVALPRRREELTEMLWSNLAADGKSIRLVDTKSPKGYREEVIPVPPAALAIIKTLPRVDARVLPYRPESLSTAFQRAVRRLGIEDLRLHDLRHEGISRLFEQGLGIEEVAAISGHTSWATLRRYTHLRPEAIVEKLNARR